MAMISVVDETVDQRDDACGVGGHLAPLGEGAKSMSSVTCRSTSTARLTYRPVARMWPAFS
jgi:hypothetical protein